MFGVPAFGHAQLTRSSPNLGPHCRPQTPAIPGSMTALSVSRGYFAVKFLFFSLNMVCFLRMATACAYDACNVAALGHHVAMTQDLRLVIQPVFHGSIRPDAPGPAPELVARPLNTNRFPGDPCRRPNHRPTLTHSSSGSLKCSALLIGQADLRPPGGQPARSMRASFDPYLAGRA